MISRDSHAIREELDNILAFLLVSLPIVMVSAYLVYRHYLKNQISSKNNSTPKLLINNATNYQPINKKKIIDKKPTPARQESSTDSSDSSESDREISTNNTNYNNKDTKNKNFETRPSVNTTKSKVRAMQIKSLLNNRSQDKLSRQKEREKQAALEAEVNKLRKQKWSEQRAFEKQINQSSSDSSDSEKQNNAAEKEILEQEIPFMSSSHEAKKNIEKHSKYLCSFDKYPITDDNSFIKILAFLYNFHRYNLSRRILYTIANKNSPGSENKTGEAVHLRTQIVHAANKISLNINTILSSQKKMKEWLPAEVGNLRQIGSNMYVKSDHIQLSLFNLSGTSAQHITFETMQTLPLYQELYQFDLADNQTNSPANVTENDFFSWMKNAVIPFLNRCDHTDPEAMDAAKMLIIIFGEYCTSKRKLSVPDKIHDFIASCRSIRNSLAHDIFEVGNEYIENLLGLAATINPTVSNDVEYCSLLKPVREAATNAGLTMQI